MENAPPPAIRITVGLPFPVQCRCSWRPPISISRPGGGCSSAAGPCARACAKMSNPRIRARERRILHSSLEASRSKFDNGGLVGRTSAANELASQKHSDQFLARVVLPSGSHQRIFPVTRIKMKSSRVSVYRAYWKLTHSCDRAELTGLLYPSYSRRLL